MTLIYVATALLLAGAFFALFLNGNYKRAWTSIAFQAVAAVMVLIAVVPVLFGGPELRDQILWSYPVDQILFRVDALSAFFLAFSLPMTLLGSIYAVGYFGPYFDKKRHLGTHFALLNCVSVSFILIYTLENAMVFLLGWEIAALSAWLLVIWDHRNQKITFAGFNYLVSTHLSLLFLIAAFMIIHSVTGGFDFPRFREFLQVSSPLRNVTFLLLMTSFGLKSAYFPFHTWLPRAHSAAPAHVSALMSGVIHKAGLFGMIRFAMLFGVPDQWMGWFMITISSISAIMGVLYTVTQRDLKRLLGYSSTENVGIAGIGLGIGFLGLSWNRPILVAVGFGGALLHILNHAFFKCLLFYAAGSVYRMTHTVDLEKLGGLGRKMPQTSLFFLIGGLAISALPPFNGFISEFLIYSGLLGNAATNHEARMILIGIAALLAFTGGVSAFAITRAYGVGFLGAPRHVQYVPTGESPRTMRFTMACHSVGVILLGLFPTFAIQLVQYPTGELMQLLPDSPLAPQALGTYLNIISPLSFVGGGLILLVVFLVFARRVLLPWGNRRHVTWGCGYSNVQPRLQYTGSSFSEQFVSLFPALLKLLKRESLPKGPFPEPGHLNTHCVDSVERRMFKVLGEGENWIAGWRERFLEESTFSFGVGLLVLIILVGLIANI